MFLQITARPDAELTAAALRHELRRPLLLARLTGWALLSLALLLEISGSGLNITLVLAGAVLAVIVPMLLLNGLRPAEAVATIEISDDGVARSAVESRHAYAWKAFTHLTYLPGQLVLALGRGRFLQIPTKGLTPFEIHEVLTTAMANRVPVLPVHKGLARRTIPQELP